MAIKGLGIDTHSLEPYILRDLFGTLLVGQLEKHPESPTDRAFWEHVKP